MSGLAICAVIVSCRARFEFRSTLFVLAAVGSLIALYSVTNAALWVSWRLPAPLTEPGLLTHFGSIHSGRYANYALYIAEQDRIPFLAQNLGQSLLASVHLFLGIQSALAALMVWVPVSLAFLTLLIFGLFRSDGFSVVACVTGTFLVMFCNIAVSATHVLVFDNGSPLSFIGYTDMIAGVGGLIVFCRWFQEEMLSTEASPWTRWFVPALFSVTWCWHAPQNLVVILPACVASAVVAKRVLPLFSPVRRFRNAALVLGLGIIVGATQLGIFLPASLREETGLWTQEVGAAIRVRPYVEYVTDHWTTSRWNIPPGIDLIPHLYENTYAEARTIGRDEVWHRIIWLMEEHLWDSLRIYGFPILGIVLLAAHLLRPSIRRDPDFTRRYSWLLLSVFAFAFGYFICVFFEVAERKWWLTRFVVPGSTLALTCLGYFALETFRGLPPLARGALWAGLLAAATIGPVVQLVSAGYRNFWMPPAATSIGVRLNILTQTPGPFIFESLRYLPDAVSRVSDQFHLTVGGSGRRQGYAVYSPSLALKAGNYRVRYRITPPNDFESGPLMDLDVAVEGKPVIYPPRGIELSDLNPQVDGRWAELEFELRQDTKAAQFRLWNRSASGFEITDMRLDKLPH